jgi:asparagine synthetase B (glutamine-hydrolysing)
VSDYIFSSVPKTEGDLSKHIEQIYENLPPKTNEFHGSWGSLVISDGHYAGFQPYETEQHLLVVIGGPVFYFRDNDFLTKVDSNEASKEIYHRWVVDNKMQWDEDLSGPFTVLLLDKEKGNVKVVTDLMSFIPVYICEKNNQLYLSTHVDALANSCDESQNTDPVSLADFVLNDVITYPYTAYTQIKQLAPSGLTEFLDNKKTSVNEYWQPLEKNSYNSLGDAATVLRDGIQHYVDRVTGKMTHVAQFISAGEDSRALSGVLPQELKRDSYVFLDSMNREGKIAQKVADVYNVNFTVGYRSKTHYLDILAEASRLVGTGHQYHHAHSIGFDKKYNLSEYSAVFGGFLSDTLLKGHHIKLKFCAKSRFPFLPQFISRRKDSSNKAIDAYLDSETLNTLKLRQSTFYNKIKELRPLSANEWSKLYPISMHNDIPNLYSTRRLFKSYEPFMCKEAVKISAAVPTSWKLNRRLFNRAMKPFLVKSKWLLHADGRYPYFSWWINSPIQFCVWFYRHIAKRIGLIKGNQGPWGDWNNLLKSEAWHFTIKKTDLSVNKLITIKKNVNLEELLNSEVISWNQKINLVQILINLSRK